MRASTVGVYMIIPASLERMDIGDLRDRLGYDEELVADVLKLFLEDYPARMHAIETAVRARRCDAIRASAHTLKGTAATIAAAGITEAASALQEMAEKSDLAGLDAQYARLASEVEQLAAELRRLQ